MANVNLVSLAVSAIVESGKFKAKHESHGATLGTVMTELFADVAGSDESFIEVFGNGKAPKAKDFIAGTLATGVRGKLPKDKAAAEAILSTLKARLSECRALHRLEGMPQKGESVQKALKRYKNAPAKKDAKPEGNATAEKVLIAADASMDDISEALSVWIANHGSAAVGLASKLADFMPVTVKRTRKQA